MALSRRAVCGLIDRQQHQLIVAGEHHAVEPAVDCAHVLGGELGKLVEACQGRGAVGTGVPEEEALWERAAGVRAPA